MESAEGRRLGHRRRNMAFARTCYDHLAGHLGVVVADAFAGRAAATRSTPGGSGGSARTGPSR